ncbi:Phenylacetic acid catabolic protein [Pendulispora albinea]|uniref:Phenylacetate-CoA oxygenase subunit PaaI n=1 Tax=Pendulispora albinea TaxID=2741071 RepID=A0ABZ2LU88_9BACT
MVEGPEQFHRMPDEYKELVVHQMMAHTEGELSGADDYLELFYPMTQDPFEKKVCCERGGEEVDHYRKGAKVLSDIGHDAAFMMDVPLQDRSLYATEAVKRIDSWPERGFFSLLGEAAVFDILLEMSESSYKPIAEMCPGVIREERVHVAHGLRIIRGLCQTPEGKAQAQTALRRWWPVALDVFGRSGSKRSQLYVKWRLRKYTNEQARDRFIEATAPKLRQLGLEVPDNHENRRFL